MHVREQNMEANGPGAEPPPDGMKEKVATADVLLVHFCPISAQTIESAQSLRIIGVCRAGHENIDVEAASQRGITVIHVTGRNANAVAEFTIGLMLSETRNIARAHAALKAGVWRKDFQNASVCPELAGKTVGIIGFGAIGKVVARKLRSLEVNVIAFDPVVAAEDMIKSGVEATKLESLLKNADIVTLHARLSPETRGMIGAREIKLMKPNSYIINTARPGLVDEDALYDALRSHRIAGAALDVLGGDEGPTVNRLVGLDNVTVTSQIAGSTLEAFTRSPKMLVKEMVTFMSTGSCASIVNKGFEEIADHRGWGSLKAK
jgi:D-3-phosphoglycerate dehydrogenase